MSQRLHPFAGIFVTSLLFCGTASALAQAPGSDEAAATEDALATQDVVYMNDGRMLTGEILSETRDSIQFRYIDRSINVATTLTLQMSNISKIERDMPYEASATETAPAQPAETSNARGMTHEERVATFGARLAEQDNMDAPLVYLVPMKGQMGTDIHPDVYENVMEDIKAVDPDLLVIVMDVSLEEDVMGYFTADAADFNDIGFMDEYRELVSLFHDRLRDIPQVLWVQDSVGIASAVALSWDDVYMMPDARLGGMRKAAINFERVAHDANMLGKYREAYMATLKGIAGNGDHDERLVDAMTRPEFQLSATWKGRDVEWTLDGSGEYIVDSSDKQTVNFNAKTAEDLRVSEGTAETLDDLMLLMGVREYRLADSRAEVVLNNYVENWRRAYDQCFTLLEDYNQYIGWANGQDALKYLGQAKAALERIVASMDRYAAVELRIGSETGVGKFQLEMMIEQLKEQIRAIRDAERRSGAGGGGRGMGGGGGGRTRR